MGLPTVLVMVCRTVMKQGGLMFGARSTGTVMLTVSCSTGSGKMQRSSFNNNPQRADQVRRLKQHETVGVCVCVYFTANPYFFTLEKSSNDSKQCV